MKYSQSPDKKSNFEHQSYLKNIKSQKRHKGIKKRISENNSKYYYKKFKSRSNSKDIYSEKVLKIEIKYGKQKVRK